MLVRVPYFFLASTQGVSFVSKTVAFSVNEMFGIFSMEASCCIGIFPTKVKNGLWSLGAANEAARWSSLKEKAVRSRLSIAQTFSKRAMNATPDEFWSHPTTRAEIEHLQETLRNIANELGQERSAVQMPRLDLILDDVRSRFIRLELDVAEPPTHFALNRRLSQDVRSARR